MPLASDETYAKRTRMISANLEKELRRLGAETPWRAAVEAVDLLGAAQVVYEIEDVDDAESKEAEMLRAAAVRFHRLLRRRRDRLERDKPFMTRDTKARLDEDIEVVNRYTHALNAEARITLALRDAFDSANQARLGHDKIPTTLDAEGPLLALACAALEYTPLRDRTPQGLCKALEKWPVLRRRERTA